MTQTQKHFQRYLLILLVLGSTFIIPNKAAAQCECAYPIIFIHGWTGDYTSFQPLYSDGNFMSAWGGLTDTYDAVLNASLNTNAYGADGAKYTGDDDVLIQFVNDPNNLQAGCIYAMDFDWFWNGNQNNPQINISGVPFGESDSNQASIEKQGWAVGEAVKAVLAANPDKKKVILVGHSMGGLASREYLQRFEGGQHTWWVDPSDPVNGHKVAKLLTLGTPHRGSNASLANLGSLFNFDERSEAVRDLRYDYGGGVTAPYLFGGPENNASTYYKTGDVNCNGVYNGANITPINLANTGTRDNISMPLPTNVKYTYYTSYSANDIVLLQFNGGDGVVADERQWLFTGGDGETNTYQSGGSIPAPNDGLNHRLSDRIHSANNVFHTSQTGDLDDVARGLDEGDYPAFAWEINPNVMYAGMAQIRADIVPNTSERTNSGNNTTDGDWFVLNIGNTYQFDINLTPNPSLPGRLDFFTTPPAAYSNPSTAPVYTTTWSPGQSTVNINTGISNFPAGDYYIRITHSNTNTSSWETPYKFEVNTIEKCVNNLYLPGIVTTGVYDVNNIITSDGTITTGTNVSYYAGNCVELQAGFETQSNLTFLADIRPCTPFAPTDTDIIVAKEIHVDNTTISEANNLASLEKSSVLPMFRRVPQPDGSVLVEYKLNTSSTINLSLKSQNGLLLKEIANNSLISAGLHSTKIDINALEPGKYLLHLEANGITQVLKIVKRPEGDRTRN